MCEIDINFDIFIGGKIVFGRFLYVKFLGFIVDVFFVD